MTRSVDVLVLGAGPAGATIARLLSGQKYSVLLLNGPATRNPHAGSLPPGVNSLFQSIGILDQVQAAGFYRDSGTTRWWGEPGPAFEEYGGDPAGYHVSRHSFDELLLGLAERAGAELQRNSRAPRVDLGSGVVEHDGGATQARFVVDATGRSGLIARQIRRFWDPRYRTMGMCGLLRATTPWDVNPHHKLMEAYDTGWAWSVPLSERCRYVCFYTDASAAREGEAAFRAEVERTVEFRRLFAEAELETQPWVRDASLYYAERYAGPNWMLVGDAGSFVDTLTSFGVEKAIRSAVRAAEAIRTCFETPGKAALAIAEFDAGERRTWKDHAWRAADLYAQTLEWFETPFWRDRSKRPAE